MYILSSMSFLYCFTKFCRSNDSQIRLQEVQSWVACLLLIKRPYSIGHQKEKANDFLLRLWKPSSDKC